MANTLLLEYSSLTADRKTGTIADVTVYTSPLRTAAGAYVIMQKLDSSNSVVGTIATTSNTLDPQTAASWEFSLEEFGDGWYKVCFITPEDYNAGTAYALYDAVQDPATSIVYRSKQNANTGHALSDNAWWEVVDALIALNNGQPNESENLDSLVYSFISTANAEYSLANAIAEASEDCCSDDCSLEDMMYYLKLQAIIEGAQINEDRGEYPAGEKKMRRIESITEAHC